MQFRRSDFDVTNRINTTDPVCVKLEVVRIFRTLYSRNQAPILNSAFDDVVRLYRGFFPGYTRCDTEYHDLQHILDVTLAMARLLDGYERSRGDGPRDVPKRHQAKGLAARDRETDVVQGLDRLGRPLEADEDDRSVAAS